MKRNLFILIVLFLSLFALAADTIEGRRYRVYELTNQNLAGAAAVVTPWIPIGEYQYFDLAFVARTDCTYFATAINDSLGFDIDYDLYQGDSQPSGNVGFYPYSLKAMPEIMSFAISDTTKKYETLTNQIRFNQSLHTLATSISPGSWIRFHIEKDAIHEKTTTSRLFFDLYFFRQP